MHYLPRQIKDVAHTAIAALSPAFDRSLVLCASDWIKRCETNTAQLWHRNGLWAVTEVQDTKEGRILHIVAAAGNYDAGELLAEIEAWALSVGCSQVFLTGRRGWVKRLPEYQIETITLRKALTCRPQSLETSQAPSSAAS